MSASSPAPQGVINAAPHELRPHPAIVGFPRWSKDSPEWDAFVDDIRDRGIQEDLLCAPDGLVIDGETRRQAALELGLPVVRCRVVSEEDVQTTILQHLVLRRNLTRGQLAYLAVPILEPAKTEALKRRERNLKRGQKRQSAPEAALSAASEIFGGVGHFGFSERLLRQARELHRLLLAKDEALRMEWEARLFDPEDPIGLGAAIAGIAGQAATDGSERVVRPISQLWEQGFRTFIHRTVRIPDVKAVKPVIRDLVDHIEDADELDRLRRVAVTLGGQVEARQKTIAKGGS